LWSIIKTFCAASAIMTSLLKRNLFIERTRIPQRHWARPAAHIHLHIIRPFANHTQTKSPGNKQAAKIALSVRCPFVLFATKRMHGHGHTGTAKIEQKPEK